MHELIRVAIPKKCTENGQWPVVILNPVNPPIGLANRAIFTHVYKVVTSAWHSHCEKLYSFLPLTFSCGVLETGGIVITPRPSLDDTPPKPSFPTRPFWGIQPELINPQVSTYALCVRWTPSNPAIRGLVAGVQWTPSNPATLGTCQSVLIREVASFQG